MSPEPSASDSEPPDSLESSRSGVPTVGVLALGVLALGVLALGVLALGVLALGVLALGVLALGVLIVGAGARSRCRRGRSSARPGCQALRRPWKNELVRPRRRCRSGRGLLRRPPHRWTTGHRRRGYLPVFRARRSSQWSREIRGAGSLESGSRRTMEARGRRRWRPRSRLPLEDSDPVPLSSRPPRTPAQQDRALPRPPRRLGTPRLPLRRPPAPPPAPIRQ